MSERRARVVLAALGLLTLLLAAAPLAPQEDDVPPRAGPEADGETAPSIAYEVAIEGELDDALRELLEQVSETRRLVDRPPPSLARLRRRAEADVDGLLRALRSRGHYAGEVDVRIAEDQEPVRVIFAVEPGPVYRLRVVTLEVEPPDSPFEPPPFGEIGLAIGEPAEAQRILDAEAALVASAREQGFALAEVGRRRAVVDHDAAAMDLTLRLETGPLTRFGPIQVEGLESVREGFVRGRLPWQEGEPVTPERLEEARRALIETDLFTTVRIRPAEALDEEDRLPITVTLDERRHRSIGIGARFRTDEGPGGSLSWEHRNLFGAGEQLVGEFDGSGIGFFLDGRFRKPDFLKRDQSLVLGSRAEFADTDAFESTSLGASVGLERRLAEGITASAAVAFRAVEVESFADEETESFGLLSLPVGFTWDRSDDLLNPTTGGRLSLNNEPFVDTFGSEVVFNKTRLGYTHYLEVLEEPQVVLAGRTAVGTMFGAARGQIPADERFFAGGGGSVRGFGFQLAGELDENDDPLGGRSLFEVSGEIRMRFTETTGGVLFLDAGSAFETEVPTFDEELRVGAGVGFRYFSPIGPLRFDVGVPVNKRDTDDDFQIYISIGQAF